MKLERICSFNSADGHVGRTEPGIDASSVVKAGNRIFMSGQTGQPVRGLLPDTTDPAELAERAMESVSALLDQAGATLADVCKVTHLLRAHGQAVRQESLKAFDDDFDKELALAIGGPLHEEARKEAVLGVRQGGLGAQN